MATRWMKWNEGTHIFEYSTDGITFNPLPLDASILTQGVIDPARLPPGLPNLGGDNVYTGAVPISLENAAPFLQYKETDQAADQKIARLAVDGGSFKIQSLTDALVATDLLVLNKSGGLVITCSAGQNHYFLFNNNAAIGATIRNSNAGISASAELSLFNDAGMRGLLKVFSSAHSSALARDSFQAIGYGAGGLQFWATDAAASISFFTASNTNPRLVINAAGNAIFSGNIVEQGRAAAIGYWIAVPYSAATYGANAGIWTVQSSDQNTYSYMLLGKTFFFDVRIINSSTGAGMGTALTMTLPSVIASNVTSGTYHLREGATQEIGMWHVSGSTLNFFRSSYLTAHVSSQADAVDIRCTGFFQIN